MKKIHDKNIKCILGIHKLKNAAINIMEQEIK